MGRIYVGEGLSCLDKKSTVRGTRGANSFPARCRPPIICMSVPQLDNTRTEKATYHIDRLRKHGNSVFDDVHYAGMGTTGGADAQL